MEQNLNLTRCRIIRFNDLPSLSADMRRSWDRCVAQSKTCSLFQSFAWVSSWWKYFGEGKTLFAFAVVDEMNEVHALFPGMIVRERWLWKHTRMLSFIGTPLNDIGDAPSLPQSPDAVDMIRDYIVQHSNEWDVMHLEELPEDSLFMRFVSADALLVHRWQQPSGIHLLIRTPEEAQTKKSAYLSKEDLRRKMKKLNQEGNVVITTHHADNESHVLLDRFVALQKQRCTQTSFSSPFNDLRLQRFWHEIIERFSHSPGIRFSTLTVNGIAIAVQCHCILGSRMSLYLTTFDPAYHRYSPAMLLLDEIIRSFLQSSPSAVYDFGRGNEAYKQRFANAHSSSYEFIAAPRFACYIQSTRIKACIKKRLKKMETTARLVRLVRKLINESYQALRDREKMAHV